MEKSRLYDLLYIVLILSLIAFMIWIVDFYRSEARECLRDPIDYYGKKSDGVTCTCFKFENMSLYDIPTSFKSKNDP